MYYKLSEQELNSISIAMPGINTSHTENGPLCHETKIYPIKQYCSFVGQNDKIWLNIT